MIANLYQSMKNHAALRDLPPEVVLTMTEFAMQTHFEPGQVIFRQNDIANRFYLIEEGWVQLGSFRPDREHRFETIGPGDVLGWSWMFEPYRWQFDARAESAVTAIFFYATPLLAMCEDKPEIYRELLKWSASVMMKRLQAIRKHLTDDEGAATGGQLLTSDPWPWLDEPKSLLKAPGLNLQPSVV